MGCSRMDNLKRYFPDDNINGSRILFTSRLKNVTSETSHIIIEPPPLSPGESWNLLEKESLWQNVAKSLSSYISQKADDHIPTLKLSYIHLPDQWKPCFLYLRAFHEDEEIPVRKLLLLWIAEGFIEKKEQESLEDTADEYLMQLINRSLLQVSKRRSDNGVKACTLHDLVLDMCCKIAEEENFLLQHQFLISKNHHRLCMDGSHHLSEASSILYNSEKIRIWDSVSDRKVVLAIKFMPDLRYLEMPSLKSSISRLQNLEVLLLKDVGVIPTYLLNMPQLRHLHFGNKFGEAPRFSKNCYSSRINSLQTLCYVCIYNSKDKKILRCSPNLRKLKCKSPANRCLNLNFLSQLESLALAYESRFKGDYLVVNFPTNIKKFTLSNIGLPWKMMSLIGTLPNLEILKLECYSFMVNIWETKDEEFQKLKFLKLDSLYLEQWNSSDNHFPELEQLVLRYCENLEMIPYEFSYIPTLQKIDVYICGENVESSALKICEEQQNNGNEEFEATIYKDFLFVNL